MTPDCRDVRFGARMAFRFLVALGMAEAMLPGPSATEAQEITQVDRVVAVVGDSVVLMSDLLQAENQRRQIGMNVPAPGSPGHVDFRQELLDGLIDNALLVQAAAQDTNVVVDDERVEAALQEQMARVEGNFNSREEMERALQEEALTVPAFREMIRQQVHQGLLIQMYLGRNASSGAIEVPEEEVRAIFDEQKESLTPRPATVTFRQVLLTAEPSDSSRAEAMGVIEGLRERILAGEDFAELATQHSQDPASARSGGELGWFRRGVMAKEFEDAAFRLPEGVVSEVIESPFGLHILRVDRLRFAERQARHILIVPTVSLADVALTRELAEEIAEEARLDDDFESLIADFNDPFLPDSATIAQDQVISLLARDWHPAYVAALTGRSAGEIVGPIQFTYRGQERFAVIRIVETRAAGAYTYEDLAARIRRDLIEQKRREALISGLRAKAHVEIKLD